MVKQLPLESPTGLPEPLVPLRAAATQKGLLPHDFVGPLLKPICQQELLAVNSSGYSSQSPSSEPSMPPNLTKSFPNSRKTSTFSNSSSPHEGGRCLSPPLPLPRSGSSFPPQRKHRPSAYLDVRRLHLLIRVQRIVVEPHLHKDLRKKALNQGPKGTPKRATQGGARRDQSARSFPISPRV